LIKQGSFRLFVLFTYVPFPLTIVRDLLISSKFRKFSKLM